MISINTDLERKIVSCIVDKYNQDIINYKELTKSMGIGVFLSEIYKNIDEDFTFGLSKEEKISIIIEEAKYEEEKNDIVSMQDFVKRAELINIRVLEISYFLIE